MHCQAVVLLVEDEILIRMMLADDLRDAGYTVVEASSGDEALVLFGSASRIDLVMSGIMMPGSLDGVALARELKASCLQLPVILVSAAPNEESRAIADRVFTKPFVHAELYEAVRQLTTMVCQQKIENGNG